MVFGVGVVLVLLGVGFGVGVGVADTFPLPESRVAAHPVMPRAEKPSRMQSMTVIVSRDLDRMFGAPFPKACSAMSSRTV